MKNEDAKPYENNEYISDIFNLVKMGYTHEAIHRAGEITRKLSKPMVEWQFRKVRDAMLAALIIAVFLAGIYVGKL
jgi:K+-transporting ATPase A subunit